MSRGLVIVAEDHDDSRELLEVGLAAAGFTVRAFPTGAGVVEEVLRSEPPFAVVTDLRMPERDGYEVIEELRILGLLDVVPLVVLTAVPGGLHGAVTLQKPIDLERLARILDRLLEGARGQERAARVRVELARKRRTRRAANGDRRDSE